ncbi:hypothetical protein ABID59_001279 [Bradyrhizobium sp. S3.3.6]|uniref:hypothetical protein n=1 Tax=Bradyrhizobium sp. S3.3.6 TaxID=3156429 RepID=UPI003399E179
MEFLYSISEYLALGLTCVVAVVAVWIPAPPKKLKLGLSAVALLLAGIGMGKAYNDDREKDFLQTALTSTLLPTHSGYDRFYQDFKTGAKNAQFNPALTLCAHSTDGLVCSLRGDKGAGTLVLDRGELAQMYANQLRKKDDKNAPLVASFFAKTFVPNELSEELLGKAAIVGLLAYYEKYQEFPLTYYYHKIDGVRIVSKQGTFAICPDIIRGVSDGTGLVVFQKVRDLFLDRFNAPPSGTCR